MFAPEESHGCSMPRNISATIKRIKGIAGERHNPLLFWVPEFPAHENQSVALFSHNLDVGAQNSLT